MKETKLKTKEQWRTGDFRKAVVLFKLKLNNRTIIPNINDDILTSLNFSFFST